MWINLFTPLYCHNCFHLYLISRHWPRLSVSYPFPVFVELDNFLTFNASISTKLTEKQMYASHYYLNEHWWYIYIHLLTDLYQIINLKACDIQSSTDTNTGHFGTRPNRDQTDWDGYYIYHTKRCWIDAQTCKLYNFLY